MTRVSEPGEASPETEATELGEFATSGGEST